MKKLAVILCLFLNAQCSDQSRRALEGFGGQTNDQATLGAVDDQFNLGFDFEGWEDFVLDTNFFAVQSQNQGTNQQLIAPAAAAAAVEEPSDHQLFLNQGASQPSQSVCFWEGNRLHVWSEEIGKYLPYSLSKQVVQINKATQTDVHDEKSQEQRINQQHVAPAAAAAAVEGEVFAGDYLRVGQDCHRPASSNQHSQKQTREEKREKHRIAQVVRNLKEVITAGSFLKYPHINEYFKDFLDGKDQRLSANKGNPKWLELYKIGGFIGNNINGNIERVLYNQFLLMLDQYIYKKNTVPLELEMTRMLDQLRLFEQKREEEQQDYFRKRPNRKRWQEKDGQDWEEDDEE